jgi:hypothetical protein
MAKKISDQIFALADSDETSHIAPPSGKSFPFLLDHQRYDLYLTVASLLKADIDLDLAIAMVTGELKVGDGLAKAENIVKFFEFSRSTRKAVLSNEVDTLSASSLIGDAAEKLLGKQFLGPSELIVLRSLAATDNVSSILTGAAEAISRRESQKSSSIISEVSQRRTA